MHELILLLPYLRSFSSDRTTHRSELSLDVFSLLENPDQKQTKRRINEAFALVDSSDDALALSQQISKGRSRSRRGVLGAAMESIYEVKYSP